MLSACYRETNSTLDMPSTNQQSQKENVAPSKRPTRKNRGRRSRKRISSLSRHSRCWDETPAHEPLLASSRTSLTSEELCQAPQDTDIPAAGCFVTPVKGQQSLRVDSQNDVSSPGTDRTPFRPLDAALNRSRPPFLSPLYSPRKPHNVRVAKPVRAMMDIFLDSRARDDESDDELFRDIERRLGISKYMRTPESPTPPPSRGSSLGTDSVFFTPTKVSKRFSPGRSPRRRSGFHLLRRDSQESPLKTGASPGTSMPWTLATHRDGFWRREAERLRMCAPKILLPSWHHGLSGQGSGEGTERLMMLAEVSLAGVELEVSELELGPAEHRGFEASGERSTVDW